MAIRVVRLGTPKGKGEGVRLGTVRRPPRGVSKDRFAADNWYDVWLPNLAPSAELVAAGLSSADAASWARFTKKYRAEMARPETSRVLDALAALSKDANFSVGCYCEDERFCHRGILKEILAEHGAVIAD
jgi:uncharacterized protein YeaO (DUF488 family)